MNQNKSLNSSLDFLEMVETSVKWERNTNKRMVCILEENSRSNAIFEEQFVLQTLTGISEIASAKMRVSPLFGINGSKVALYYITWRSRRFSLPHREMEGNKYFDRLQFYRAAAKESQSERVKNA